MVVHRLHATTPLVQAVTQLARSGHNVRALSWTVVLLAIVLRCGVAFHGHSGEGMPPMYGDFEAQRHWMEVTYHLPLSDWYRNTTDNDLLYWGLDYPPLTAYWSYAFGYIAHNYVDPAMVALGASRGIETPAVKFFMRASVLVSDIAVYFSAVALFALVASSRSPAFDHVVKELFVAYLLLLLCQPSLILIDHGHFQYNSVMLGLTLAGIALVYNDAQSVRVFDIKRIVGAVCFCLAVLFKQMALYYALPFFFFLLGCALKSARTVSTAHAVARVAVLGAAVLATFAVCLAPFGLDGAVHVFSRVFPVGRGLFEDKVANFWCAASVVYKFRQSFEASTLLGVSAIMTLLGCAPSCINVFMRPSGQRFLFALFSCSMCFFLVSFQVHEKSILLPMLPLLLLTPQYIAWGLWWTQVALFSLFPLLRRDQLVIAYIAMTMIWTALRTSLRIPDVRPRWVRYFMQATYAVMAVWHVLEATVPPPARLPDLYVVANCVFCWACFTIAWLYFLRAQMVYDLPVPTKRD